MGASSEFLFDRFCSGRLMHSLISEKSPNLVWKTKLPSYPPKGPESTAVIDDDGNLYFGSHDGCIYSLDYKGNIRWSFRVGNKVYSSPVIYKDSIIISSGEGYLLSLDRNFGTLLWAYSIGGKTKSRKSIIKKDALDMIDSIKQNGLTKLAIYSFGLWACKSWASPKVLNNLVIITGQGGGIVAVDADSGKWIWKKDLANGKNVWSGVSLTEDDGIIVYSKKERALLKLDLDGSVVFSSKSNSHYESWGTPSIDPDTGDIYYSLSYGEDKSIIISLDSMGKEKWVSKRSSAIRGSISISYEEYVAVVDFDGYLNFYSKQTGELIREIKLSGAQRALWTTPSIDKSGHLLVTTKDSNTEGSLICLNKHGKILWKLNDVGKSLSTPVVDASSRIYFGSWKGQYYCYECE